MAITMVEELVPDQLNRVRQDLRADPELAAAGPAAVLPCLVDHAVDGHGPVLGAINGVVEEVGRERLTGRGESI
jgi:hypothetical protein